MVKIRGVQVVFVLRRRVSPKRIGKATLFFAKMIKSYTRQ